MLKALSFATLTKRGGALETPAGDSKLAARRTEEDETSRRAAAGGRSVNKDQEVRQQKFYWEHIRRHQLPSRNIHAATALQSRQTVLTSCGGGGGRLRMKIAECCGTTGSGPLTSTAQDAQCGARFCAVLARAFAGRVVRCPRVRLVWRERRLLTICAASVARRGGAT